MEKEEVLEGLKIGCKLRCDRRNDPLLPWLLSHPDIENSGIVQATDQYSYIEFWWKEKKDDLESGQASISECL